MSSYALQVQPDESNDSELLTLHGTVVTTFFLGLLNFDFLLALTLGFGFGLLDELPFERVFNFLEVRCVYAMGSSSIENREGLQKRNDK